jgi:hypothetical protein
MLSTGEGGRIKRNWGELYRWGLRLVDKATM